jgi:hypothetical protein
MFNIPATLRRPGFAYPYSISQSCMFDDPSNTGLYKSDFGAETSATKATLSVWVKRTGLSTAQMIFDSTVGGSYNDRTLVDFQTTNALRFYHVNSATASEFITNAKFRDCGGWYHIVIKFDSTSATAGDRVPEIWVNGLSIATDFGGWATSTNNLNQNEEIRFANGGGTHDSRIGAKAGDITSNNFIGYMAEMHWIDGQALDETSFGKTVDGIWVPIAYTGTYGNNGFYLDFSDNTSYGDDTSGNTNDFTDSSLGTDHQVTDSPTKNYCVLNYNAVRSNITTFSEGGLVIGDAASANHTALGTMVLPKTGKWYWEVTLTDVAYVETGITKADERSGAIVNSDLNMLTGLSAGDALGILTGSSTVYKLYNGAASTASTATTPASTDVMQVAYDADNGKLYLGAEDTFYDDDGTTDGDPAGGVNESFTGIDTDLYDWVPFVMVEGITAGQEPYANFGQRAFTFTPPSGYKALCSANLPYPSILQSDEGADVLTYTGDDASSRNITGLSFTPDLVWVKNRDNTNWQNWHDSARGDNKTIYSNSNSAEVASSVNGWIETTITGGFQAKKGATTAGEVNASGQDYVAFCLKKAAKFGFDIQLYEGTGSNQNISHNLGGVPELIIIKDRDSAYDWIVYHHHALSKTDPETDYGLLDSPNAWADANTVWNDTAPTATQFTVGTANGVNDNAKSHVAYLFRSIPGFSKVFSYEGNGSATGPYLHLGFRPRFVFYKDADVGTDQWEIIDTARNLYNPITSILYPSLSNVEATGEACDFTSEGIKIRANWSANNGSGKTIVGIAFADQPGKYSNAR